MIVVVIISLASAAALPMYADAITKSKKSALTADGRKIYDSMMAYYSDFGEFPSEDSFDTESLDPLTDNGYLKSGSSITSRLQNDQLLLYIAPDVGGTDQQFFVVMRLESDPNIIVAALHTNLVSEDGDWTDGVFVITADDLEDAPGEEGGEPKGEPLGGGDPKS